MVKKLKIRKLVDNWTFPLVLLFFFIRILQWIKSFGWHSKKDGWRTATRSYLRTEHSKFILAVFRLNLWSDKPLSGNKSFTLAKNHIIERLALFLRDHSIIHRQLKWGRFSAKEENKYPVDIIYADFFDNGILKNIEPYFDLRWNLSEAINESLRKELNYAIIDTYNELLNLKDVERPRRLKSNLIKWIRAHPELRKIQKESISYIERVLNSVFIYFEMLPLNNEYADEGRFKYPNFIKRKHPGFGIFNICCRLTADYSEADLWFQTSHISIDGVATQEILSALKSEWTTCGDLVFPSMFDGEKKNNEIIPEQCSTEGGENARYHASKFIDFSALLKIREKLNLRYKDKLSAPITIISMFGWGLSHHDVFRGCKFLFPVDLPSTSGDKQTLGFVIIRPSLYFNKHAHKDNFLAYQQEFNRRLYRTQTRINEIYKLFEIFALAPPPVYWLAQKFMKSVFSELLGTVVITTIKDADFFIAPFSDVILDGFIAFGNFSIPTKDKRKAGLVSVKSAKDKTILYIDAVEKVAADFNKYL